MGEFQGIRIIKLDGGTGRRNPSTDGVMALVAYNAVLPADVVANSAIETAQPLDAEAKGINASFDANNKVLTYDHISEFYRIAPEGTLYVILTDQPTAKQFFESATAKALFRTLNDVKGIGYVYNADVANLDVDAEITACQAFVNELAQDDRLIDGIYLEARNTGKASADKRGLNSPAVRNVALQDPTIAAIDPAYAKYAAVGAVLGAKAVRKVNEDLGSVDILNKPDKAKGQATYPLTDAFKKRFVSVNLSDGTEVATLTQVEKNNLTKHGYIYGGTYVDFAGVYLNGEPTCIQLASDFAYGSATSVWNKAARGIRKALLPKVKSILKRDPSTGYLTSTSVSQLELIAEKPLRQMIADDEISGAEVYISKEQRPDDQTPLKVKGSITKDDVVFNFEVALGLV